MMNTGLVPSFYFFTHCTLDQLNNWMGCALHVPNIRPIEVHAEISLFGLPDIGEGSGTSEHTRVFAGVLSSVGMGGDTVESHLVGP